MKILVTGGAGFIGSHLCRMLLEENQEVTCYDKLDSRVVNPFELSWMENPRLKFICANILDTETLERALRGQDLVIHVAAQSAVDYSIRSPLETVQANAMGTTCLLEAMRRIGIQRLHYVSTDEVFGSTCDGSFNEESPLRPTNPYAAGKAAGEMIIFAWANTFKLDYTITNGVNNYGPFQAPEKLIPRLSIRALLGKNLPVYGDGRHRREWLYVDDHCRAIWQVVQHGKMSERYCVGHALEMNINVVERIAKILGVDRTHIIFVEDRPGHDIGYVIDSSKIRALGWGAKISFDDGLEDTVLWYKENRHWWNYFQTQYEI